MEPHLRFFLLGPFEVWRDGERLPPGVWRTRKHAALLKILIGERRRAVSADRLVECLWPDLQPTAGLANLYVGISLARRVLEPQLEAPADSSYILTHYPGYLFDPSPGCWIDVEEFGARIAKGDACQRKGDTDAAIHAYQAAASLYRGDYLADDLYEDWAIEPRERLREDLMEVLIRLHHLTLSQGNAASALSWAQRALALDPCREQAHRQVMRAYYIMGRRADALRQFERCGQILRQELDVEPMQRTLLLYRQIFAGQADLVAEAEASRPAVGRLPFIGRESELATLRDLWKRVERGTCQVGLVSGEAGVGKTRLVEELAARIRSQGATFLHARCRALEQDIPYQPLRDALSEAVAAGDAVRLAGKLGPWAGVIAGLLPQLWEQCPDLELPPPLSPADERARLLHALARLVQSLTSEAPCLFFVDDLHWADRSTLQALSYLSEHLTSRPILLMGAYRVEEAQEGTERQATTLTQMANDWRREGQLTELPLHRLSQAEVTALIAVLSRSPHGGKLFSQRIYRETEGNPFFLAETLRTLVEQGVLYRDETGAWSTDFDEVTEDYAELPIPATVRDAVLSRCRPLSQMQRRALATLAVIGRAASFGLWQRATGVPEKDLLDTLEWCLARQLLVQQAHGRYDFDHGLIREILLRDLCPERRRLLHHQVADALAAQGQEALAGEIAHHYLEAGMWAPALDYLEQAGQAAMHLYAYRQAWPYFAQARDLLERLGVESPERRYNIVRQMHLISSMMGRREETGRYLEEALALARSLADPARIAETLYLLCRYHFFGGNVALAEQLCREEIDLSRQVGDARLETNALRQYSLICRRSGRQEEAWTALERALDLSRQIGDTELEVLNLNVAGAARYKQGDYAGARTVWQSALQICRDIGYRPLWAELADNLGEACQALGCYSESLSLRQEGLEVARAIGYRIPQPDCLLGMGRAYSDLGQHAEAIPLIEQALSLAREVGQRHFVANVLNGLARARLRRGDRDDARQALALAEEALALSRAIGLRHGQAVACSLQGRAFLAMGQVEAACRASEAAIDLLEKQRAGEGDEASIYYHHAQNLSARGKTGEAAASLSQAMAEMEAKAAGIADPGLRHSFLENVPIHRAIRQAWQEVTAGG